tara:strand:- start:5 stop:406 length:402 start_codon:yes stop_codon:yes gene_type:complete
MPLQRVSQGFKDISMSFGMNPLTDDLVALKNINAINRSIRNIVLTIPGEVPFNPNFGSHIGASLFENMDEFSAREIKNEIMMSIRNYEPRVNLNEVIVRPNFDANTFDVIVKYDVIGIAAPSQTLEFALVSAR